MKDQSWMLVLVLSGMLALAGCKPQHDIEEMAGGLCSCMRPMAKAFDGIEQMASAGDADGLEQAMKSLEATADEADRCTKDLEEQYGEVLEKEESRIRKMMQSLCPDVARTMEEAEAGFE